MADDVYQDAARQPPDPITNKTLNNNNYKTYEANDNTMEEEQEENRAKLVTRTFYGTSGTTVYGTPNLNINKSHIATNNDTTHINSTKSVAKDSKLSTNSQPSGQRSILQSTGAVKHRHSTPNQTSTPATKNPPTPTTPNTSNTSATASQTTPTNMDISIHSSY
jgi:hypothetical protein